MCFVFGLNITFAKSLVGIACESFVNWLLTLEPFLASSLSSRYWRLRPKCVRFGGKFLVLK